MQQIHVMNNLDYILNNPQVFFGKNEVNGSDLLWSIMIDLRKITGFKCVIHDDDLFVIHSDSDWITKNYQSVETFLKTADAHVFDPKNPDFYHYGIFVFVYSTIVATLSNQYLMNFKGNLPIERMNALMKKYNLAEEGFYFIFSVKARVGWGSTPAKHLPRTFPQT